MFSLNLPNKSDSLPIIGNLKSREDNKLHYVLYGSGNLTIIFLHGNSLDSESFLLQTGDELAKDYRLMSIDLPGHGKSLPSKDPSNIYSLPGLAREVSNLINELTSGPIIIAGHSLGGHIAIESMTLIKNCVGLLIWGTPPLTVLADLQFQFLPHPDFHLAYEEVFTMEELERIASVFLANNSKHIESVKRSIIKTDPKFRKAIGESVNNGKFANEKMIIESLDIPVAIFHGEFDRLVNLEYLKNLNIKHLWGNKIHLIENAGHCCQLENADIYNHLLKKFVASLKF